VSRSWRGNSAKLDALIIDEYSRHALVGAAQFLPFQFSRRAPQLLLATKFFRQRLIALDGDERAAFAAAGRLRLGKERGNGVKFIGRDRSDGAQDCLALRHRVSPPFA
jgi:hypothetical protein